jgi:hypothetical protein
MNKQGETSAQAVYFGPSQGRSFQEPLTKIHWRKVPAICL